MSVRSSLIAASVSALAVFAGTAPAFAECKTMGFTVNDYGKDGPTKDAKELLDKDIAKWAADNGIEKYTVGKKTVKCELFLDVILFDEHTCTASAAVCWGANAAPAAKSAKKDSNAKPASTSTAEKDDKPPVETGAIDKDSAVKEIKEDKPAVAPEVKPEAAAKPDAGNDAAERAAAAAERAAAAAERAAAAAEKAAQGSAATTTASSEDKPAPAAAAEAEEGIPKP